MRAAASSGAAGAAEPPAAARRLARLLGPVEELANRLWTARWSPLYQSGSLAVLFLAVAAVTGIYLFLFYRIAAPYESVLRIDGEVWGGSLVRSLHRYSADLAIVAAALHLVKKLAQGHTFGPRARSWWSGVGLLGILLLCGWTGLVMAWDELGAQVAVQGARLIDLLPLFSQPIGRLFSGAGEVGSGFFFMNLFLHVALPLGLVAGLWFHVSRVARPVILPARAAVISVIALLVAFAAAVRVPLPPRADLLAAPGELSIDLFYAFWLPLAQRVPPAAHAGAWLLAAALLTAVPFLWRPRRRAIAVSRVDEERCTGCTQCYADCPYEAIAMVDRAVPSPRSQQVARVDPDLCVGCGICAGSCAPMSVGPSGRTGREQLVEARAWLASASPGARQVVLLGCRHGIGTRPELAGLDGVVAWPTGCSASVHTSVLELLVRSGVGGVFLLTCAARDCLYREGPRWLGERVEDGREAELQPRVDRRRVAMAGFAAGEVDRARRELAAFVSRVRALEGERRPVDDLDLEVECDLVEEASA